VCVWCVCVCGVCVCVCVCGVWCVCVCLCVWGVVCVVCVCAICIYRVHMAVQCGTQAQHCSQIVHAAIPMEQDGRSGHCAL